MAWEHSTQAVEPGVVTDPRDFIANVDTYARAMAGFLDRDNFQAGAVTSAKIGVKEIVAAENGPYGTYGTVVVQTIGSSAGQWAEVTSARRSVSVEDGEVIVDADVNVETVPTLQNNEKWRTMLTIDGVDVAYTDWVQVMRGLTCVSLTASAPVVTGTCTVQVFIQYYADPWRYLTDLANGTNVAGNTFTSNPMTTLGSVSIWTGNTVVVNRRR